MQWSTSGKTEENFAVLSAGAAKTETKLAAVWPGLLLILGGMIFGGFFMFAYYNGILPDIGLSPRPEYIDVGRSDGRFTSPLLECKDSGGEIRPFNDKVEETVNARKNAGEIAFASVYFRDLNNGPWFGINETEPVKAGSALRLPIMMWYLRQAVYNPGILKQTAVYPEEVNTQYTHDAEEHHHHMSFNHVHTASEFIESMITFRDMHAATALRDIFSDFDRRLDSVYSDLGIAHSSQDAISLRSFGTLLTVLFNASYLSVDRSEYALDLLSRSPRDGIASAIPDDVEVAHTIGTNIFGELKQVHACGIVYFPKNPYLLCVAVRGDDFGKLNSAIRDISAVVYGEVVGQTSSE